MSSWGLKLQPAANLRHQPVSAEHALLARSYGKPSLHMILWSLPFYAHGRKPVLEDLQGNRTTSLVQTIFLK